jgi:hypothetical protein
MGKVSKIGDFIRFTTPEKKPTDKAISYSQFSMWSSCPHRWKINYIDKQRVYSPSIHTVFGSAMHETIQHYLYVMFNDSVKNADKINLGDMLQEQMINHYGLSVIDNGDQHFSSKQELTEFYEDGIAILDWLKKRRGAYFSNQGYELLGIEIPLYVQATDHNPNVIMAGFIDLVIRDTENDRIIIYDIKTSTSGWNEYAKKDKNKTSQLVLYKSYFAKQFGYDEDKIDIEYFIVKRKLIEGFAYPQKRVQQFIPASGKPTRNKLIKDIEEFVKAGFKEDGSYNIEGHFPAVANNGKNCKYCEFSKLYNICPKENRI